MKLFYNNDPVMLYSPGDMLRCHEMPDLVHWSFPPVGENSTIFFFIGKSLYSINSLGEEITYSSWREYRESMSPNSLLVVRE
jgi:hypothetical protein